MDEHVPFAITKGLQIRGVDVQTVQELGLTGTDDALILDRATKMGLVVFTRDVDFLAEATRRQRNREMFTGVIYAHQLRVSIGECITDLELIGHATDLTEHVGEVQYLPLK